MSADLLPLYLDNNELRVSLLLPDVLAPGVRLSDMLDFCRLYRIKGIAALFLGEPADVLFADLSRSGRAFLHFLVTAPDEAKATSRAAPFFDAVAATDAVGARAIAQASRPIWNPTREYEEDFLYVWFLMKHFLLDAPHAECAALLERYATVLGGEPDVHLDVCKAFLAGDAVAFHEAICILLEREDAASRARIAARALSPVVAATEACLNIEGLALLRLAEAQGFPTESDYVTVPSAARARSAMTFEPDAWKAGAS